MNLDRLLAIALISSLAACGSDVQPDGEMASKPAAEPAADPVAEAVAEPAEEKPAPKPDRFANMYVDEITETYNPGLKIGDTFPSIQAWHEGKEVSSIEQFVPDRGAIFIAVRSVDW